MKVILLTEKGLSLGFNLDKVSELKKTSRGVKGIELNKDYYDISIKRIKNRNKLNG